MAPDPTKQTFSRLDPEITGSFRKNPDIKPKRGPRAIEIILFSVFAILLIVAGIALYTIYSPRHREVPNTVDKGVEQDRLNLLFLGVSGDRDVGGGKDLADSIIFVSLKPSTRQAAIVSVPRDLYGPVGSYGKHRLNMAHSIGAQSGYPGGSPGEAAEPKRRGRSQTGPDRPDPIKVHRYQSDHSPDGVALQQVR